MADVYGDLPVCGMGVAAPDAFVAGYEASGSAGTAARSLATSSTIGASVNLSDDHVGAEACFGDGSVKGV